MSRNNHKENKGYTGIILWEPKKVENWGVLTRSAYCLGVDFVATIGNRYPYSASDTTRSWNNIPFWHFETWEAFYTSKPNETKLVAVEITDQAKELDSFNHPRRACYLLGGEDRTIPNEILNQCDSIIKFESKFCLNVSAAGSIVMYDRMVKLHKEVKELSQPYKNWSLA